MSFYRPGDTVAGEFFTYSFTTGGVVNADTTPTGTVNQNGTDDGAVSVTITNLATGRYSYSFTIPTTYANNDNVTLTIAVTIGATDTGAVVWQEKLKIFNPAKNLALSAFEFKMYDTSGNPATGLTVSATRSIDGGAYAACTNSVVEVSGGTYKINLSAADLNGTVISLRFTATGAKDTDLHIIPAP